MSWQNQITKQEICSPWGHGRSLHGEHECGHVGLVESDRVPKLTKKVYLNCVDQNYLTTTMLTEWRNLNRISWPLVSWQNDITKPKLRSPWGCGWPSHEERELGHVGRVGADRVVRLTKMVYLNCVDQNMSTTTVLTKGCNINHISWPLGSWQNKITKPKLGLPQLSWQKLVDHYWYNLNIISWPIGCWQNKTIQTRFTLTVLTKISWPLLC